MCSSTSAFSPSAFSHLKSKATRSKESAIGRLSPLSASVTEVLHGQEPHLPRGELFEDDLHTSAKRRDAEVEAAARDREMMFHLNAFLELCSDAHKPFYASIRLLTVEYIRAHSLKKVVADCDDGHIVHAQQIFREPSPLVKPNGDMVEDDVISGQTIFTSDARNVDAPLKRDAAEGPGEHDTDNDTIREERSARDSVTVSPFRATSRASFASRATFMGGLANGYAATVSETIRRKGRHLTMIFVPPKRTPMQELKLKMWRFLEQPDGSFSSRLFHGCWNSMICISVCSGIASDLDLPSTARRALVVIDIVCTLLFTCEFILKMIVAGPHRKVFLKSWYTVVDVIVIAQGYLSIALQSKTPALNLLKTQAPILRLLKIARTSPKWRLLIISMKRCVEPLLIPLYLMVLLVTFCGSLLYWVEANFADCIVERRGQGCPGGTHPAFLSIPHAMWFVVVTISTVGYGDVYPKSDAGKVINGLLIIAGVGYLAMPLAIIGNQFGEVWKDRATLLVMDKIKANMGGKVDMDKVQLIFESHDDGSGTGEITFENFEKIIESLDVGLNLRDMKDIFNAIDEDMSGLISLEEFSDFIHRY